LPFCFSDPRVVSVDVKDQDGFGTKELYGKLRDAWDGMRHMSGLSSGQSVVSPLDGGGGGEVEMVDISVETDGLLMDDGSGEVGDGIP
jgi:hypothetical protein